MYYGLSYIIENINGDVVVFDWKLCVVVIMCGGRYCFIYIGDFIGLVMMLLGVCIDVFLNILMCVININIVMMIDKDGEFLFYIMIMLLFVFNLNCLCYDMKIYCLWVGLSDRKSKVIVNRYIIC